VNRVASVGHAQLPAKLMPSGAIQQHDSADPTRRTDCPEDISRIVPLIAWCWRPRALFGPDVGQAALLADTRFILPPELDRLAARLGRDAVGDQRGKLLWNGPPLYPAA
jgi:hypothetical protein